MWINHAHRKRPYKAGVTRALEWWTLRRGRYNYSEPSVCFVLRNFTSVRGIGIHTNKMNDVELSIFIYTLWKIQKKKRKSRKYWVRSINNSRLLKGAFYTLYDGHRTDEEKYFNYFRMPRSSFHELVEKITHSIMRNGTNMRCAIPL